MKIIGTVIAREGSERLPLKNILPYKGEPLVVRAIERLLRLPQIDMVVFSTESPLLVQIVKDFLSTKEVEILRRPYRLAGPDVPSMDVFKDISECYTGDIYLNYNCNFPAYCNDDQFEYMAEKVIQKADDTNFWGLSNPYALWAQHSHVLSLHGNGIERFDEPVLKPFLVPTPSHFMGVECPDIHTAADYKETVLYGS